MSDTAASSVETVAPGARLREARERQGLTIAKAAEQLRLDPVLLEAIEAGQYASLGAPVYARGHLRKYAGLLGLPGDELVAAYDREAAGPAAPSLIPAATARGFTPPRPWLLPVLAIGLAVLVAASLWWASTRSGTLAALTQAVEPAAEAPLADAAEPAAATDGSVGGTDEPTSAADPAALAADSAGAMPGEPAPVSPAGASTVAPQGEPVAAATPDVAPPAVTAAAPAGRGLTITLNAPCWVEVYDAAGRRVAFEMAPAGAVRRFDGGPWKVLLGNAAAAALAVDGRKLPVPAEFVARNVAWLEVAASGSLRRAESAQPTPRTPET